MAAPDFLLKGKTKPEIYAVWGPTVRHIGPAEFAHYQASATPPVLLETDDEGDGNTEIGRALAAARVAQGFVQAG